MADLNDDLPPEHTVAWYLVQDVVPWQDKFGGVNNTPKQVSVLEAIDQETVEMPLTEFIDAVDEATGRTYVRELLLRVSPYALLSWADAETKAALGDLCDLYPVHLKGFECEECDAQFIQRGLAADHRLDTEHEIRRNPV